MRDKPFSAKRAIRWATRAATASAVAIVSWGLGSAYHSGLLSGRAVCTYGASASYAPATVVNGDVECVGGGAGAPPPPQYTGNFTGYAYGNQTGNGGVYIDQGMFANHSISWCPADPAAHWPNGTWIMAVNPSSVPLYDSSDTQVDYFYFLLEDVGDRNCVQGDYWADIYFGRYRYSSETCACNNGGTEYCVVANSDSCGHAARFGRPVYTYSQTSPSS